MSELCKKVTDINNQLNSLPFAIERLLKAQATAMACPPVTSTSVTLCTTLPATSVVTTLGSAAKPSGHLTMDPAMVISQQFLYMPISNPLHDHWNMSNLGGKNGLGSSATPFLGFFGHPASKEHLSLCLTRLPRTLQHPSGT